MTITTETQFKAGDKVRVLSTGYTDKAWIGVEGIVQSRGLYSNQYKVKLTDPKGTGREVGYVANLGGKLELIEKPFTFADIQVGDTIRRTATFNGATEVREGVVGSEGSYYWANEQGNYILAYDTDGKDSVTLELLNRPEPEPTLLEGTKAGDQLVLEQHNGISKVHTKKAGDSWGTLVFKNGVYSHVGFVWDQDKLEGHVESAKSHRLIKA